MQFDSASPALVSQARGHSLSDLPRRSAARVPNKLAIVHRDVRLTFAQFDAVIDRTAAAMHAAGLRAGDRVAILSHNCWQFPVLNFAAARLGVVFVPVNFMLKGPEIAYILDDCHADAFVVEDALVPVAEEALFEAAGSVRVRVAIELSDQACPSGWTPMSHWSEFDGAAAPEATVEDDDVIRIMYTSGTESRPKGALLTSRSLMWQYTSCIVTGGMSSEDIEIHALPLYHCAQLDNFLSTDIYLGATSIIVDGPDPEVLLRTIDEEQVTNLFCPPTVWISLMHSPHFASSDLRSLKKGYYGASALPVEVLKEMNERLPGIRFWNFYGQTEMSSLATALGPDDQLLKPGSAGRPALNVETCIVDDRDRPLPPGEVGEIVHRSPHATIGYLGQPEKTAESFSGGWFHSGDLGYVDDDGYLWIVDRKKDMIKTGGENVATREVEEALYLLPGVDEAAVFAVPHPRWIEAVAAAVVVDDHSVLDENAVIEHCRAHLAGYKVPKYVVLLDSLPKNPSGKILKRSLREQFRSPVL